MFPGAHRFKFKRWKSETNLLAGIWQQVPVRSLGHRPENEVGCRERPLLTLSGLSRNDFLLACVLIPRYTYPYPPFPRRDKMVYIGEFCTFTCGP